MAIDSTLFQRRGILGVLSVLTEGRESPRQVADFLTTEGIKGTPGGYECCPLAEFFKACGDRYPEISAQDVRSWASPDDAHPAASAKLPPMLVWFVENFDRNVYPELVVDGYEFDD